ncbi:MAG TPA: PIN domain-containing protein [Dehalococcoidia bacterium]|nr:PIN domain-containing protein [Dehalococcoidia bacterium]
MAPKFVDTNVFLRYFTRDAPDKAERCFQLFQQVKGGVTELTTSESVIAELVSVLSSPRLYNVPRHQVRDLLAPVLSLRGLRIANRRLYLRALDFYAEHDVDFEDALSVAHMERRRLSVIVSYDQGFDRFGGVVREEP